MNMIWFIIVAIGLVVIYLYISKRMVKVKISRFEGRRNLEESQIADEFAPGYSDKEKVLDVLRHVSSETQVPLGKLRPTDDFSDQLAPVKGWEFDDGIELLITYVKDLGKAQGIHIGLHDITNLGKYVKLRLELEELNKGSAGSERKRGRSEPPPV